MIFSRPRLILTNFSLLNISKRFSHKHEPCLPRTSSGIKTVYGHTECQSAIIVGGVGDIGIAVAKQLLCEKVAKVGLIDLDICRGKETVTTLNCTFGKDKAVFARANITDKGATKEACQILSKEFSNRPEILVNAAGIWDENLYEKQIEVNLTGVIYVNNLAKQFVKKPGGVVINIVGLSGLELFTASPVLGATYAGVIAFSRALGHERNFSKTGIRVVTLCVGITDTNFMKDAKSKTCCREMAKNLEMYLKEVCWQKPDAVAKAVIQLIRHAPTGSLWVVEGSRLFSVKIPSWETKRILESQFM